MSTWKKRAVAAALALALGMIGPELIAPREAEAVVGRPLTPVSVAGVTRRTVRRCASPA